MSFNIYKALSPKAISTIINTFLPKNSKFSEPEIANRKTLVIEKAYSLGCHIIAG